MTDQKKVLFAELNPLKNTVTEELSTTEVCRRIIYGSVTSDSSIDSSIDSFTESSIDSLDSPSTSSPKLERDSKYDTIILDLDHTLIHAVRPHDDIRNCPDTRICIEGYKFNIYFRPCLDEFISMCFEHFSMVILWSSGGDRYVNIVIESLAKHLRSMQEHTFDRVITPIKRRSLYDGPQKNIGDALKYDDMLKGVPEPIYFLDDIPGRIINYRKHCECHVIRAEVYNYMNRDDDFLEFVGQYLLDRRIWRKEKTTSNFSSDTTGIFNIDLFGKDEQMDDKMIDEKIDKVISKIYRT